MTFLNPLVLFGLLAASIPVLLHIFNLRKLKTIEFSTLTFLKELQKTRIRRLKIRQILLLILRTLLVVLLVIAFSRPTLKGSFSESLGPQSRTTAVFIIDDSYSMTAVDDQGELLKQAKQLATETTNLLRDGDEVYLLKLSEARDVLPGEQRTPERSRSSLRSAISEIRPSFIHGKMEDALRAAAHLLSASVNYNKELYFFSDFQSGILASGRQGGSSSQQLFAPENRFFFVPLGNRQFRNISVDAVTIPNTILEPHRPFSVVARVTNHGENEITNALVSVFAGGTRVAQKGSTLPGRSSADVTLSVVPKSSGFIQGIVALESDDLEFDNNRYVVVAVPYEIRVLLVGNPSDLRYVKLALAPRSSPDTSLLRILECSPERMSGNLISAADVIVLSNAREFSATQIDVLRSFVTGGGGLLIFPGSATTQQNFNSMIAGPLRLPHLVALEGISQVQSQSFVEFGKADVRHPLFTGMFEEELVAQKGNDTRTHKAIESAKVKAYARYLENAQSLPVITLSNGAPFLLEQSVGQGRVLLFSVAANPEWSDFPLKGLFVPLLHRALSYLAQVQSTVEGLTVGEEVLVKNIRSPATTFVVQDPRRNEFSFPTAIRGSEKTLRIQKTTLPGIYVVKSGSDVVREFAVNVDPDESKTERVDEQALAALLTRVGIASSNVHSVSTPADLPRVVAESRYGVELWKHFLLAALAVAIIEMLVAKDNKKELAVFTPQHAS
ncbi:MAG: BatA domain-containing protein [Ignavibacteriales bacterium]|nr:BatA domain-containing protein [Ignavibacteriales bacterium]